MNFRPDRSLRLLVLAAVSAGAPALHAADESAPPKTPVAVVEGRTFYAEDLEGATAYRLYRLALDRHVLLRSETERRVDALLVAREAERRGTTPEALIAEIEGVAEPATDAEIDRYLAEHPAEGADPGRARERVRHYLTETRRIERRLALMEKLRADAGYRFLLEPPAPPRTEMDLAGAPTRGPDDARVTILHYSTYSSRASAASAARLAKIASEHPGLRFVHRHLLNDRDEAGLLAARLAFAAQRRGEFWTLHDLLFARNGRIDADVIVALARDVGLTPDEIEGAREDPALLRRVKHDIDAANRAGVPREPALFVNGRFVSGLVPLDELRRIVREELDLPAG